MCLKLTFEAVRRTLNTIWILLHHVPEANQNIRCQKYRVQPSIHLVHATVPTHATVRPWAIGIRGQIHWHQSGHSSVNVNGCQNEIISSDSHQHCSLHDHLEISENLWTGTVNPRGGQHQAPCSSRDVTGWIPVV